MARKRGLRVGMDLLFVAPGVAGGGVYAEKLLLGLADADPDGEYTLYTRRDTALPALPPRFRQYHAPVGGRSVLWRAAWEYGVLPRVAAGERFDVFHGPGTLCPAVGRTPLVLTVHDLIYDRFPASVSRGQYLFSRLMLPRVARRAARVIVPSEFTRRDVIDRLGVRPERTRLVPYGPGNELSPLDDDDALVRCGVRRPYVVTVARGYAHKNLDGLLRAFARLRGFVEVQLALVGERYQSGDAVDRLVGELGLRGRVVCTGRVSTAELRALYTAAEAFAFPSLAEGLGLPVLEAMACGVPVVASGATAVPEAVGDAGVLADAGDPEAFAAALARVLGDAGLREELRRRGRAWVGLFSWRKCAEQTLDVYRELA